MVTENDLDCYERAVENLSKRFILSESDVEILDEMKECLSIGIQKLRAANFREVNIEIELNRHIKQQLKDEEIY